jgi:hypothetical protein
MSTSRSTRTLTVTEFAPPPLELVTSVITVMLSELGPCVTICGNGQSSPSTPEGPSPPALKAPPPPTSQPPTPPHPWGDLASLPAGANSLLPSPPIGFLPPGDGDTPPPPLTPPSDLASPLENAHELPPPPPNGTNHPPPWHDDSPPPPPPWNHDEPPKPPSTADVYQGGWTTSYPMPTGHAQGLPEIIPSGQSATASPSKGAVSESEGERLRVVFRSLFWVSLILMFLV